MSPRFGLAAFAVVVIATTVLPACSSGLPAAARNDPPSASNRTASGTDRTSLCVWTSAPEGELTVTFRKPRGGGVGPQAVDSSDACATYSPSVSAEIAKAATGKGFLDLAASNDRHQPVFALRCEGRGGWKFTGDPRAFDRSVMDGAKCQGFDVKVDFEADSEGDYEFRVGLVR